MTAEPERYFRPPYVGARGWLGVRMDGSVDWETVERLCGDAWRSVAMVGRRPSRPGRRWAGSG